jgi:ribosomal protein S18 acetylase RimI-like enzyme
LSNLGDAKLGDQNPVAMQDISIRKALPAEVPLLNEISLASKQHWGYPPEWMEHWRPGLLISDAYIQLHPVYVAEGREGLMGFIALEKEQEGVEITHLWVLPAFMGQGCGQRLLRQVLAQEVPPGTPIVVEADPHAEGFYKRQGFVPVGSRESYPKGRFLPILQKIQGA